MVVECGKCSARFELDSSRIPEKGIRVRCSRCKHAFFQPHPDASPDDAIHALAQEAAHTESAPVPGATQDLSAAGANPEATSEHDAVAAPDEATAGFDEHGLEEESDWEFNQEPAASDAEADAGSFFSVPADSGLELDDSSAESDASLGAVDDIDDASSSFDPIMNGALDGATETRELEAPTATGAGESPQPEQGNPAASPGGSDDFAPLVEGEAEGGATAGDDLDLDDPESWDFFADSKPERSATSARANSSAVGKRDLVSGPGGGSLATGLGDALQTEIDVSQPASHGVAARVGRWVGWACTLSLVVAAAVQGWVTSLGTGFQIPEIVEMGSMNVGGIEGHWLETSRMGTVYIVNGFVTNPGRTASAPGRRLEFVLLDDAGRPLERAHALAGRDLARHQIRELDPEAFEALQARGSSALSWKEISAGASVEFVALFRELPDHAVRFEARVSDAPARVGSVTPADPIVPDRDLRAAPDSLVNPEVAPPGSGL